MLIRFKVAVLLEDHHATFIDTHYSERVTNRQHEENRRRREAEVLKLCASLTTSLIEHSNSPTVVVKSASSKPFKRYENGHTPAHDDVFRKHAYKADAIILVDLEIEWHHLIRFGSHNHALALIDRAINNAPTLLTPRKYITLSKAVQRYEHY